MITHEIFTRRIIPVNREVDPPKALIVHNHFITNVGLVAHGPLGCIWYALTDAREGNNAAADSVRKNCSKFNPKMARLVFVNIAELSSSSLCVGGSLPAGKGLALHRKATNIKVIR